MIKKDQRVQSEQLFWKKTFISVIVSSIKSKLILRLFQENKSYDVKTIALILCLHVAVHHVLNNGVLKFKNEISAVIN